MPTVQLGSLDFEANVIPNECRTNMNAECKSRAFDTRTARLPLHESSGPQNREITRKEMESLTVCQAVRRESQNSEIDTLAFLRDIISSKFVY
jgi:hypothetical protein